MIRTDLLIIGAGPVGLFTVFEAGLMKMRCHLIDALPQAGGQLKEIYPKKPIYDIPGFPSVLAGDLVDNLMEQAAPFKPGFTLGERAESIEETPEGKFLVRTQQGTLHEAAAVIIAGGLGSFEPRRPQIENLSRLENKGIHYIVKEPEAFLDGPLVISGGGDSALDWAIYFAQHSTHPIHLVHRSESFRAHKDSVSQVQDLAGSGRIQLHTHAEVKAVSGETTLEEVSIYSKEGDPIQVKTPYWLPLFGLSPKLGPIADWDLALEKNAIVVDHTLDFQTSRAGIYAVGDVNQYPGKLKLILCGFHEATLAVQSAYKRVFPDKRFNMKYTTVQGVQGFEEKESVVA